ncbi:MAG: DUF58 domain-containing protein, partial [Actinobacteria bacterium]|nr:DUF58 domain-containing protein [Actinomycetota bacterium]
MDGTREVARSVAGSTLTRRGRLVLCLGPAVYAAAWAFGSDSLYPVAVGLVLAVGLAWAWVRLANRPVRLRRETWGGEPVEGDDVPVSLELEREGRAAPATFSVVERIDRLGERHVPLRPTGRGLSARFVLSRVPRGRYAVVSSSLVIEDPFALARAEVALPAGGTLLVLPRLVRLDHLFSASGVHAQDGRRLLLRRPAGFDLHSVREYERGESLRKVHWATTARRGQLMVKELEDAPRDEVAVLLDAVAGAVGGQSPESSFDVQVRAAGSILAAHARAGRSAVLLVNSLERETRAVRGDGADFRQALELLASAEPTGRTPASALLAEDASAAARALELTVVTSQLSPTLVDRLVH